MKILSNLHNWEANSLAILQKATINEGIKASCANTTNYSSVFTRDAVMSGIAGLMYGDVVVIEGLRSTINMLHKTKGSQGQIASNYKIADGEVDKISFGTLSPKIDSATWYLIAIGLLMDRGFDYDIEYVKSTVDLLEALEYNGKDLIYIPQGGNWADEYPYEGYILYDQILRCWALQLVGKHFNNQDWIRKSISIQQTITGKYFNKSSGRYICSFTPSGIDGTFDFAAHILLGLLDDQVKNINYLESLSWIEDNFLNKGKLPSAFFPVIDQRHEKWKMINSFHLFDFKNKPNHYHNGGIWFIWLGWYALVLHKYKKHEALQKLTDLSFTILDSLDEFNFDEYLTGDTTEPNGTKELCYTATGILFLCSVQNKNTNTIHLF